MSIRNRFPVWRRAGDLTIYRTMGGPVVRMTGDVMVTGPGHVEWKTPFQVWDGCDYLDVVFDLDQFLFRWDDDGHYLACPCGAPLYADNAGDLYREIMKHCGAAGHPKPGWDR